jgi:hypothetical protein
VHISVCFHIELSLLPARPAHSNRHGATSHAPYVKQVQLPKELTKQSTVLKMLTSSHFRRQSSQRDDLVQEAAAQLPNVATYGDVVRRPSSSVLNCLL